MTPNASLARIPNSFVTERVGDTRYEWGEWTEMCDLRPRSDQDGYPSWVLQIRRGLVMSRAPALVVATLLTACDGVSTASVSLPPVARNFVNGPAELPHVLRSGGRVISAFFDVEQDMLVVAGAPEDPTTDRLCGGSEPRQFVPVQWVRDFDDIVKQLAMLDDINLLVYQPIPATPDGALCETEPIARGTGRLLRTDNDFFGAFGRANAVLEFVHGMVSLADGGEAWLTARFNALGSPAGELRRFETIIHLDPAAKP